VHGRGACTTTQIAAISVFSIIGAVITMGADGSPAIVYEDSGNLEATRGIIAAQACWPGNTAA